MIRTSLGTVLTAALEAWDCGLAPIPIRMDGTKRPALERWDGRTHQRRTREQVASDFATPRALGIVCGAVSGGLEMLEFEAVAVNEGIWERWCDAVPQELYRRLETGYLEFSPSGGNHLLYRVEGMAVPGNTKLARRIGPTGLRTDVEVLIETRGEGGYVVTSPSSGTAHASGLPWQRYSGSFAAIPTITAAERGTLVAAARVFDAMPAEPPLAKRADFMPVSIPGGRPGDDFDARHTCGEVLERNGWVRAGCRGDEVRWVRPGKSPREGHSGVEHTDPPNVFVNWSSSTVLEVERGYSPFGLLVALEHGGDAKAAARELGKRGYGKRRDKGPKAIPADVTPSPEAPVSVEAFIPEEPSSNGHGPYEEPPWPEIDADAYRGLAGDVVRFLKPHTEADQAGLLVTFLTQFGAIVGPGPHIRLSGGSHPARLYAVIVGDSSARKGAANSRISELMLEAFPIIVGDRWEKGLSSPEGLIELVRDPRYNPKGEIEEEGASDKRLYVFEAEFTAVLERMRRQGNTLSQTLRDAWDSGNLRTITKGSPQRATGAHICIVGNATPEELEEKLSRSDVVNGFANRFLFVAVRPPAEDELLPFGSDPPWEAFRDCAQELAGVVQKARLVNRMEFASDAREAWPAVYAEMRRSIPSGPIGHYCGRADTHVLRLSLIYALLAGSRVITWEHMESAQAMWDYCRASVALLLERGLAPAAGRDEDVTVLLELLSGRPDGLGSEETRARLGWSGSRLAATRARAERLRLIDVREVRSPGRGRSEKRMVCR